MRRVVVLPLLAAVVGLTVAGCSKPVPDVSFFASGHTTSTAPIQYCNTALTTCRQDARAAASLRVPAGRPLQISVPPDVADSAWVVVFKYKGADGKEVQGRSNVFPDGQQFAYTLNLPSPSDQLELAQVQRIGGVTQDAAGDIQWVTSGVWALNAAA